MNQLAGMPIDVRVFVPIERHRMLLRMFAELPVGEKFRFINDHDPLPLCYELRSIHGDVVGWEYIKRDGIDWQVEVTRLETSKGREFSGISTLMDMRRIAPEDLTHVIFHRYGMMEEQGTMEIIASTEPVAIRDSFRQKYGEKHLWSVQRDEPGNYVAHIFKKAGRPTEERITVVAQHDARPYEPAMRHEIFFTAFNSLRPGEAFVFINDHDPKPLYYQIEAESTEPFNWEYLERGPEVWTVRVGKKPQ
ncbi:MAG: DUF2249 domain-containing protein [Proteobacteria bacterium]|nr:DUF2249 domain-containing protein [Pseudomonadota bacterium]HQR03218.1 DUF2249 domain-containing protein [Rhodocyclaceae bacterium]